VAASLNFTVWPSSELECVVPEQRQIALELGTFNLRMKMGNSWNSELDDANQPVRDWIIEQSDLPSDEAYRITQAIPVKVTKNSDLEYTATFDQANLSISGTGYRDAFQALIYEILDVFDRFSADVDLLGPEPRRQLDILKAHLVKTNY
jgi:hypothetical protein